VYSSLCWFCVFCIYICSFVFSFSIWFCVFGYLLVVNTSASDCLERLVAEMIYYVSRGSLNSTHSLSFIISEVYPRVWGSSVLCWPAFFHVVLIVDFCIVFAVDFSCSVSLLLSWSCVQVCILLLCVVCRRRLLLMTVRFSFFRCCVRRESQKQGYYFGSW